jgi:hypothetical protein
MPIEDVRTASSTSVTDQNLQYINGAAGAWG